MGLFSRAHDIMQAKANRALDKAEKPDEMLDLSYEKMLEQITQVRRALVEIAASRKRIELQESQLQASADHLQDQARAALGAGREDLAREALNRKAAAQQQIDDHGAAAPAAGRRGGQARARPSRPFRPGSPSSAPRRRPSRRSTPRPRP